MSRHRRRLKIQKGKKRVPQTLKQKLSLVIAFLIVTIILLVFKVGNAYWPAWVLQYRTPISGTLSFFALFLIFFSPVILEVDSDPRALSGPGKDPRQGWRP